MIFITKIKAAKYSEYWIALLSDQCLRLCRSLLSDLERCELDAIGMSRCFIEHESRFDVYSFYCSNYPRSVASRHHLCHASSPVSERPRTTVSVWALHPGLQCSWYAAASAFRQPSCRTAFPARHLRPSGVLSCWPDGLKLTSGFHPGSNEQHRLF